MQHDVDMLLTESIHAAKLLSAKRRRAAASQAVKFCQEAIDAHADVTNKMDPNKAKTMIGKVVLVHMKKGTDFKGKLESMGDLVTLRMLDVEEWMDGNVISHIGEIVLCCSTIDSIHEMVQAEAVNHNNLLHNPYSEMRTRNLQKRGSDFLQTLMKSTLNDGNVWKDNPNDDDTEKQMNAFLDVESEKSIPMAVPILQTSSTPTAAPSWKTPRPLLHQIRTRDHFLQHFAYTCLDDEEQCTGECDHCDETCAYAEGHRWRRHFCEHHCRPAGVRWEDIDDPNKSESE